MPKSIASALLTDINANVTTLCTCVEIVRRDGRILRMTTHDVDITVDSKVYQAEIPFMLGAIQSSSQLNVDNTELTLYADGTNILLADIKNGLYEYSECTIFQVSFKNPEHGAVIMRRGWFGPIEYSENNIVRVTVTGLLKVLDLEIGRIYQPLCDADFGDSRCKVAVDLSQIYSPLNVYHLGEWVYVYDPAAMTALTVVNPSFEVDGTLTNLDPITGWTKTPGASFQVRADGGTIGTFSPNDGSLMLVGDAIPSAHFESAIWQDIDIGSQIGGATIDTGKIVMAYMCNVLETFSFQNLLRIKLDLMNANGEIIATKDSRYMHLDAFEEWRDRACVMHVMPGARTARIWIYSNTGSGDLSGANAFDNVRCYYWDYTTTSPNSDVVHRVTRLSTFSQIFYPFNPSFEQDGAVANANNPTITGWTIGSGNWWQVVSTLGSLTSLDGVRFLAGGNDGGATQRTYTMTQLRQLFLGPTAFKLDQARVLLGKMVGRFTSFVGWADTTSRAKIVLDFLDGLSSIVGTYTVVDQTSTVGWAQAQQDFVIPPTAEQVKITLSATSPVGSGNAQVAFDNLLFIIFDAERADKADPIAAFGSLSTDFNYTVGAYTLDGNLVWKALTHFVKQDVVSAVTDPRKVFVGTTIAGANGTYETGGIQWLSGNNAGLKNIVRTWDSATKTLKLYFKTPHPIQIGDRFTYIRACQRRFIEDCQLTFENTLNFRGFPYLPGRLTSQ